MHHAHQLHHARQGFEKTLPRPSSGSTHKSRFSRRIEQDGTSRPERTQPAGTGRGRDPRPGSWLGSGALGRFSQGVTSRRGVASRRGVGQGVEARGQENPNQNSKHRSGFRLRQGQSGADVAVYRWLHFCGRSGGRGAHGKGERIPGGMGGWPHDGRLHRGCGADPNGPVRGGSRIRAPRRPGRPRDRRPRPA